MAEKLVVIGGTAAGLSAASKAKRLNPELDILVFEKSGYISYGACGLPYFVGGMIEEPDDLVAMTAEEMRGKRNIPTFIHQEVTEIDRENKRVEVKNLESGETATYPYDKLVIATGASPIIPSIPGIDAGGIYYLRTVEDGIRLKHTVAGKNQTAAIIGGGFIGLEMAEEMSQAGVKVHVYERMERLLPFLDESFSQKTKEILEQNGVTVHLGADVTEIVTENGRACGVRTVPVGAHTKEAGPVDIQPEEVQPVDFVLMSIGVLPASSLAEKAGLKLGLKNGIAVDETMQTSDPSIWACGDCVEMKHLVTGAPVYVPLGTTANKQGRIAGENVAGGRETFKGVLGSTVTKVFDLYIAATGLSREQAVQAGFDAVSSIVTKADRASYYPGGKTNTICLVLDRKSGRLLGAQGIGSESIAGRINVFATAITCGMTVGQINELDLVYAPPVAPVYDPVLIAASQAMKKVERQ